MGEKSRRTSKRQWRSSRLSSTILSLDSKVSEQRAPRSQKRIKRCPYWLHLWSVSHQLRTAASRAVPSRTTTCWVHGEMCLCNTGMPYLVSIHRNSMACKHCPKRSVRCISTGGTGFKGGTGSDARADGQPTSSSWTTWHRMRWTISSDTDYEHQKPRNLWAHTVRTISYIHMVWMTKWSFAMCHSIWKLLFKCFSCNEHRRSALIKTPTNVRQAHRWN